MSVSCVFSAPVPVDFRADLLSAPIGDIGLDDLAATAHGCQRTVERIAAVPLDVIQMSVHHDGSYRASFEGRETVFGDGDVSLLGMHRKFDYVTRESSRTTTVSIPTRLLGQQAAQIDSLFLTRLQRTMLTDAITAFVASLSQGVLVAHSKESEFVALALVDLARALIANQLGERLSPEDVERGLRVEIHEYLNRHLSEPSLSPESIAAAMNISVRYLYNLFASEDQSVARHIRGLRSRRVTTEHTNPARIKPVRTLPCNPFRSRILCTISLTLRTTNLSRPGIGTVWPSFSPPEETEQQFRHGVRNNPRSCKRGGAYDVSNSCLAPD